MCITNGQEYTDRSQITDKELGDVEGFLQDVIIHMMPEAEGDTARGRPRILPALALWAGLLVCVLRGFTSQLALWRLLTRGNFWFFPRFPVSDQAVYKRLAEAGTEPLERLFQQIRDLLAVRLEPFVQRSLAPFATEVFALDETTLDSIARMLPGLRDVPNADPRLLPGKLAAIFDLRRQLWRYVEHIPDAQQNEKVVARSLVERLPKRSLILADLGYFGFAWFDWLTDADYWWISRLRSKTSYIVLHCYYQQGDTFDGVVFLGKYRADQAAHAVRLVQFRVKGTLYSYVTNVLDPRTLPIRMVAELYARRWDIELAIKLVKRELKLHLLWSSKPVIILQQIWATLIIAQILQALRLEIAGRAQVDVFDVSMPLLVEYLPKTAYTGQDPIQLFVEHGRELRFIRPSTRNVIEGPIIAEESIRPLPPDLVLIRKPRYAERKCQRRSKPN